nr:uncharacterized protein LOC123745588 isoform X2 [Procambarus clarkii]
MTHTVLPPVDDTVKERADVHPLCVYQHGVVEFGHHSVRGVIISFYGLQHPKGSSVIIISISIISSCSSSITRRVSVDGGVAVGHQPALQPGELARSTNRLKTLAHAGTPSTTMTGGDVMTLITPPMRPTLSKFICC